MIDFETVAGLPSVDGMSVTNQFAASHGVVFALADGTAPRLAQVGAPRTAFEGYQGVPDTPAPGTGTGSFFLTDDGTVVGIPLALVITYVAPVSAASGLILDIDNQEQWDVEAFDAGGTRLDVRVLGPNPTLNGSATAWSFDEGARTIAEIRITFTGVTASGNVGLAFDNFDASRVQPGIGQANSNRARLEINGVGAGTGNGPYPVDLQTTEGLSLQWNGPPGAPIMLLAGPLNPGGLRIPCAGSLDVGTPPGYGDLVVVFSGVRTLILRLDGNGSASQTFSLPTLPPGVLTSLQGLVLQPPASPCQAVLTAAFQIRVL